MTSIKSIRTIYRGTRYRSKLEADWARFLDAMDIEKLYEPEGRYVGPDDATFIFCDFYLPELNAWFEVKGVWTKEELLKFSQFADWVHQEDKNSHVFAGGPGGLVGLIVPADGSEEGNIVEACFGVCTKWECRLMGFASRKMLCLRKDCGGAIIANPNLQGGPGSYRWPDGSDDPAIDRWVQWVKEGAPWYADVA